MATPRFSRSRRHKKARRTSGNLTLNSTAWADVDTGLDLTLKRCQVGDEIICGFNMLVGTEAVGVYFDVVSIVSAAPVNSFAARAAVTASPGPVYGFSALQGLPGVSTLIAGLTPPYTVTAGDLVDGSLTARIRYATSAASNKTLRGDASGQLDWWVENIGPQQQD